MREREHEVEMPTIGFDVLGFILGFRLIMGGFGIDLDPKSPPPTHF